MILSGILLTPTGEPLANASVRLVAVETSLQVLQTLASTFTTDAAGAYSFDAPQGRYRVAVTGLRGTLDIGIITVSPDTVVTSVNELLLLEATVAPRDPLLAAMEGVLAGALAILLPTWAYAQVFRLVSATRDSNGAIVSAEITWPDGTTGIFNTDVASVSFPGAIDAWHATYGARVISQPAVTRDANGAVTVQPAITIT